ncbi:hypothetical protein I3260_16530 [Photobacterium damselae]|uniref:Uncharacterized protein n=1 Tax=Photobacterium damselae subsp. damselae TaxID=85581 RepID=A0AAD3ZX70_PHODD|nr:MULTISPECIES: hypothetical protein [Gammaproteobacteria]KAB1184216.1 hypothetical protein F6450_02615 [Photobacterium damselae subsp. damselae]MCG3813853.1 hypothetical protein [Photobacterium damselae]MCG3880686.1 hypothetical protein [Psychrobacter sp. Ps6]UKA11963.1 hypothetical protein IHC91_19550 [Photobacterium damselae subsp. damselae]USR75229.1 hypothetical protein NGM67_04110 [Photobacterium damselae]
MSKNVALLVAEAPWFSFKDNHDQASCLPFFEGIKRLVNDGTDKPQLNIYHCNYYDNKSLEHALNHLIETKEDIQILYIGGHGNERGSRIANATINKTSDLIRQRGKKLKGLIVSSCMAASTDNIAKSTEYGFNPNSNSFQWVNGPNWVIGYKYAVSWFQSALVETAIIKEFTEAYHREGKLNSKADILECLVDALIPFDLETPFAEDKDYNSKSISETLRVWVRAQGADRPTEVTKELFELIYQK